MKTGGCPLDKHVRLELPGMGVEDFMALLVVLAHGSDMGGEMPLVDEIGDNGLRPGRNAAERRGEDR
jgi:hypothetical protein